MDQYSLKKRLHYDPDTGIFTHKATGKQAGNLHHSGYRRLLIQGREYREHRIAWLYMTGHMPTLEQEIDHDNHIRNDNRWCNLNLGTKQDNQKNTSKRIDNSSGCTGVSFHRKNNTWLANICVDNKIIRLGSFTEYWDTVCARKSAEYKFGFHINHGKAVNAVGELITSV